MQDSRYAGSVTGIFKLTENNTAWVCRKFELIIVQDSFTVQECDATKFNSINSAGLKISH